MHQFPDNLNPNLDGLHGVGGSGGRGGEEEGDDTIKAVAMDMTENITVGKSLLEAHFEG